MKHGSFSHQLLHVVLGLREDEENAGDTILAEFGQFSLLPRFTLFVQNPVEDEGQRVEDRISGEDTAKVILGRGALQLKNTPYTIDTDLHQLSIVVVVIFEEVDQHGKPPRTDKHLQYQCRGLIHLPHKGSRL